MNIYIRSHNIDFFKYCTPRQTELLQALSQNAEFPAGAVITEQGHIPANFIILLDGELELVNAKTIGSIYPGEFCGEMFYPHPFPCPFTLKAVKPSKVMLLPFAELTKLISQDSDCGARIHAALNDSLCLKIIRLTHRRNNG